MIVALAFDPESQRGYIIPKQKLRMVIEVMDDIESGRIVEELFFGAVRYILLQQEASL